MPSLPTSDQTLPKICGVARPISACGDCTVGHWEDVHEILSEAIGAAGYQAQLISYDKAIGVIHKRIITNLIENPIVVFDLSSSNANVLFELGLRLSFEKPVVLVQDDVTDPAFDTAVIEYLQYPRSLRYPDIEQFKKDLSNCIRETVKRKAEDPNYSPFLRSFGTFETPKFDAKEVPATEFMIAQLNSLNDSLAALQAEVRSLAGDGPFQMQRQLGKPQIKLEIGHLTPNRKAELFHFLDRAKGVYSYSTHPLSGGGVLLTVDLHANVPSVQLQFYSELTRIVAQENE